MVAIPTTRQSQDITRTSASAMRSPQLQQLLRRPAMSESMTTEHKLNTRAHYFDAVKRSDKPFEVRRDDRRFQRGDILILQRTSQESHYYVQYESDGSKFGKGPVELRKRIT